MSITIENVQSVLLSILISRFLCEETLYKQAATRMLTIAVGPQENNGNILMPINSSLVKSTMVKSTTGHAASKRMKSELFDQHGEIFKHTVRVKDKGKIRHRKIFSVHTHLSLLKTPSIFFYFYVCQHLGMNAQKKFWKGTQSTVLISIRWGEVCRGTLAFLYIPIIKFSMTTYTVMT